MSKYFILGLIAGEGSFQLNLTINNTRSYGFAPVPKFSLLVHEKDILDKIVNEVGLGKVKSRSHDDGYVWEIINQNEVIEFSDWIKKSSTEFWESTNKYKQFEKWNVAVDMICRRETNYHGEMYNDSEMKKIVDISYDIGMPDKRKMSKDDYYDMID